MKQEEIDMYIMIMKRYQPNLKKRKQYVNTSKQKVVATVSISCL